MEWPHGFWQELLPTPEYQEGDRVQFLRDEFCLYKNSWSRVSFHDAGFFVWLPFMGLRETAKKVCDRSVHRCRFLDGRRMTSVRDDLQARTGDTLV